MPHPSDRPILIIDDVTSEAMTLDLLCQSFGVSTLHAASTHEAAELLRHVTPAAIITDLIMPGADGLDCLYLIADQAPSMPVMVVTGSDRLLLKAAVELGDVYGLENLTCVAKPVDARTLHAFIQAAGIAVKPPAKSLH